MVTGGPPEISTLFRVCPEVNAICRPSGDQKGTGQRNRNGDLRRGLRIQGTNEKFVTVSPIESRGKEDAFAVGRQRKRVVQAEMRFIVRVSGNGPPSSP